MDEFAVKNAEGEVLKSIAKLYGNLDLKSLVQDFTFCEFTLEELGLPSADKILTDVLSLGKEVGLQGWMSNNTESQIYKGYSLTYNPDFFDSRHSLFHQTWGSPILNQSFSRKYGLGGHAQTKNTYYDTYAFRKIHPVINAHLGKFLKKFRFSLLRSRVAYYYGFGQGAKKNTTMHVDEFPYELLRINIPLQTSKEHILDIIGNDEYGNKLDVINKHLEVGKVYLWNTRIPHRICLSEFCKNTEPRIHLVLGFSPWFDYNEENDSFVKNQCFGQPIQKIVDSKLFML